MTKVYDLDLDTTVWFMYKNKPTKGVVKRIWSNTFVSSLDYETVNDSVWYYVEVEGTKDDLKSFRISNLFLSKEDLKKSL
jgi:hypothetical protein